MGEELQEIRWQQQGAIGRLSGVSRCNHIHEGDWRDDAHQDQAQSARHLVSSVPVPAACPHCAGGCSDKIVDVLTNAKLTKQSSEPMVLEMLSKELRVYWMGVKVPILKDRDFVIAEWNHRQQDGKHLNAFVSVEHPQCAVQKKYVRADILMGGWLIDPAGDNSCDITHITGVDPNGQIPSFLKTATAAASADAVIALKKLAEA